MSPAPSVAVITGAGGGLGLACAHRLGARHRLLLTDNSPERLSEAADELAREFPDLITATGDITDERWVDELAEVTACAGPLAAVINTAGISRSMADGHAVMRVNLIGTALLFRAFLPLACPGSVAICVSSIGAYRRELTQFDALLARPLDTGLLDELDNRIGLGNRSGPAYDLAKRGVVLACEHGAAAWGARGARIVCVSPGPINTPMGAVEGTRDARGLERRTALGRIAQPDDVASVIDFLIGPGASFVTGCDLRVDGGLIGCFRHHAPISEAESWEGLRT